MPDQDLLLILDLRDLRAFVIFVTFAIVVLFAAWWLYNPGGRFAGGGVLLGAGLVSAVSRSFSTSSSSSGPPNSNEITASTPDPSTRRSAGRASPCSCWRHNGGEPTDGR